MNLKQIIKISRPRFWSYLGGTYLVGFAFGAQSLAQYNIDFWIYLLFFLFIANYFLYGVNDYFDWETDKKNPKKDSKEYRLQQQDKKFLKISLTISFAIALLITLLNPGIKLVLLMLGFLFLSYFYSAKPIRFKSRPILDFASNILYIFPAIIGYYQATGTLPPTQAIMAGFSWAMAMHLFSAIPDIKYDKKAGVKTTAVRFGKKRSLFITKALWLKTTILTWSLNPLLGVLSLIYPIMPLILFFNKKMDIAKVYWYYPYINMVVGFILFIYAVII